MKSGAWAAVSSVVLAAASSACCWLPLVAVGLGFGAGAAAAVLERYRGLFLAAAALLLAVGFHASYRRAPECAPDGSCAPDNRAWRSADRAVLWLSAAAVVGFAFFPEMLAAFPRRDGGGASPVSARSTKLVLEVGGMTCASCEGPVERALLSTGGVRAVHADATTGRVTLELTGGTAPDDSLLRASVTAAGYAFRGHASASAGAPAPLVRLSPDGHELRDAFNRDAGSVRLIAFLSPT